MVKTIIPFFFLLFMSMSLMGQTSLDNDSVKGSLVFFEKTVTADNPFRGDVEKVDGNWKIVAAEEMGFKVPLVTKAIFRGIDLKLIAEQAQGYIDKNGGDCYSFSIEREDDIWCVSIFNCK